MPFYLKKISVALLHAPLTQPFRTALGDHHVLENVLFTAHLSDGTRGYGEAAIATHITGETIEQTVRNLHKVGASLIGRDIADPLSLSAELYERFDGNSAAFAAVEMALVDAVAKQTRVPCWKLFGPRPHKLTTDITIVIADLNETEASVERYYKKGFRSFKVKIGRDLDLDIKRVLAVKRLAPRSVIYLDANQGYTASEILKFLKALERHSVRIALLEQPVPRKDWEGLKKITRSTKIPVCADESVRTLVEAKRAIAEKAVSVINIKLMKSGIWPSHEIALAARAGGVELMIGGMMESSLAMTAAAHLAAGLGCFKYIDLDTPFFIKGEVGKNPYLSERGVYDLKGARHGIGINPRVKA